MKSLTASVARCGFVLGAALGIALAFCGVRPALANTTNCYLATSQAPHQLCFLDFGGYTLANGTTTAQSYPFTIKLPDGSLVSGTITNSGQALGAPANNPNDGVLSGIVALPTLTAANGNSSPLGNYSATAVAADDATSTTYEGGYLGVLGNPAFYENNTTGPIALSNITIKDSTGASEGSTITIAGSDAETTDAGDYNGGTGGIYWTTTGGNLVEVQLLNQMSTVKSVCPLTLNAGTATCLTTNTQADPGAAYILSSQLTAATQSFTMKAVTSNTSGEAFAFAFRLGTLKVSKTVGSRLGTDQFTVAVKHGTATAFSATTTGTTTGAASTVTGGGGVVPGVAYNVVDATTTGSNPITQYASTVACTNATAGSTTTLPSAGSATQNVTITPAIDDAITCAFTNNALTLTNTPVNATNTDAANTSVTDLFTLTNTSTVGGTFAVATPVITPSSGTAPTPTGYSLTVGGTTTPYTTLAALNAAIAGMAATAANGSIVVGVTYTTGGAGVTLDTVALPATISSGTGTSAVTTGTETDSLVQAASLGKTVQNITQNGAVGSANTAKPKDVLQYVLTFTNTTGTPIYGLTLSDKIPDNTTYFTGNTAATCVVTQGSGTPPACTAAYTTATTLVTGTLPTKASGGNPLAPGATAKLTFQVKVN